MQHWTEYGYNEQGQLIYQEDANDRRTDYEYDSLGRRSATILPLTQRSTMTYNAVGNLQTMTDFNGHIVTYLYDEQNRLTEKQFQDGSKVQYGYLRNGLQDTVTFRNSAGLVTSFYDYDYDERDRLTKRTDSIGGVARSIDYGYDIASNRTSVTTASGTTTYSYDDRNRLDVTRFNGAIVADYDYDAASRLTKTTFGNGTEETRVYDTLNRLKELTSQRGTTELSKYVYTLDKVGNRKTAIESVNGQNRSLAYTYDDLYRLTDEAIVDGVNGNRTANYTYDNVGNRLTKTVNAVTTAYAYDGNDRLLDEKVAGAIVAQYSYDNNGSTLTKTENGVTTTYVWNDDKRLVSATVGTTQVEYVYNDQGIRISAKQNGVETRYLLDEGIVANVWEEYAPNGTVQASYGYGYNLITQTQAGQTSYYLVDGLGSTRLLTDNQGQVLNAYGYEAFGETVSQSGTASNQYQYAGEQFDSAIGDYYLRQRFYDTSSGHFSRMDTYEAKPGNVDNLNKYTYSRNNPVNYIDPTGLYSDFDGYAVERVVQTAYEQERSAEAPYTIFGKWTRDFGMIPGVVLNFVNVIKPDIVNFAGFTAGMGFGLFNEIKPLSSNGVYGGFQQMLKNEILLGPFGFEPDPFWHSPLDPIITSAYISGANRPIMIFNIAGILFYTDDLKLKQKVKQIVNVSVYEAQAKLRELLLTASDSVINELGRSKYLIENSYTLTTAVAFATLTAAVGIAAYTSRYA